jgi:iron complex transport system substrate-binding protein
MNSRTGALTSLGLLTLLLILILSLAAARSIPPAKKAASPAVKIRLVSLAPSNTELVYSLGVGRQLVGVSDACNFPSEAAGKEKVGNSTSIKMEKIARLQPDLVLLISGQESLDYMLRKHGFHTLMLDNSSVENISKNLLTLGKLSGHEEQSRRLAAAFEKSIQELKTLTGKSSAHPRVFICIWPQPLMSAGRRSFMSQGIAIAGGINCTADLNDAYPGINPEKLLLMHPDIILVPQELSSQKFWLKQPWSSMQAVKGNHVYVLPQHETDCLMRPTLRFVDAVYWLAARFHPDLKAELDDWKRQTTSRLVQ